MSLTQRATARVDLGAIAHNVRRLRGVAGVPVCAVVKADAYGHGAVPVAETVQRAGAAWLAVAAAREAAELRAGGIQGRILVLGALSPGESRIALEADADVVAWHPSLLDAGHPRVHVKLDSGMGRLGTRDARAATQLAVRLAREGRLAGLMTHFATADDPDDAFLAEQLERFRAWAAPLKSEHPSVVVHAANSAATFREARAAFDMVRPGVALYGMDPFGRDPAALDLRPALELTSYVATVKRMRPGESTGYGRRFVAQGPTTVGIVPIGYGDGWRRALSNNAEVLVRGRRLPLVGTVSMDNIAIDAGAHGGIEVGDEVVLLGERGGERLLAEEVARRLQTINYEVTCGLLPRVPREHVGG
ncbi:MAG TPA: alanine racemase [Baekduia sp.]|nr:alanine racemase [Baekduia sp.]